MEILALFLLSLGIVARAISELAWHGKLKWSGKHTTFWGNNSWMRKYNFKGDMYNDLPPNNWYYRTFNIDYRERFPLSATALVFLTDGMHLMQFVYHLCLALSFSLATGIHFLILWCSIVAIHAVTYRILSK